MNLLHTIILYNRHNIVTVENGKFWTEVGYSFFFYKSKRYAMAHRSPLTYLK